jgi:glycine cleavage system H protein
MSAELVFMMGEYESRFPTDRLYAKNHMWAQVQPDQSLRFGLTAYAVRLLQDVYFLDLVIEPAMPVQARQEIGSIESKKAESSLYVPVAGQVTQLNAELIQDPSAINLDKYGAGWMFELQPQSTAALLEPSQYIEHLQSAWEVAQRTIKGQANA